MRTPKIEISRGHEAERILERSDFIDHWRRLRGACAGATYFQSDVFVLNWYRSYRKEFEPVIAASWTEGELSALLLLAADRSGRRLLHAGDYQAEYQCWL